MNEQISGNRKLSLQFILCIAASVMAVLLSNPSGAGPCIQGKLTIPRVLPNAIRAASGR